MLRFSEETPRDSKSGYVPGSLDVEEVAGMLFCVFN